MNCYSLGQVALTHEKRDEKKFETEPLFILPTANPFRHREPPLQRTER